MNYQLVIAEKPSVARSIAGVIGADKKQDGYMKGNGYLVSWCIGHLVSLADAGTYDERFKKWRYDDLPILPQEWQYIIPDDKKKQFDTLRSLMERPDVTGLVCATDAGREGELIFRFVYQMAGCKKPFQRLWISSMEDAAIKDGFAHLKPGADYDNLYQSALCRAQADWLVGINATRLFSILYHKTLTVGRVQTPTLKMLVDREAKISSFQKEKYHIVQIAAGGMEAASERIGNADDAKTLKAACETAQAVCVSVTREKKTEQAVKIFGLRDSCVNGGFQLCFPALALALGVPFGIALSLVLARLHHRQAVYSAQPVIGAPDIGVALAVGNVLALVCHIHRTENYVVMQMALVYVGGNHIGIFTLQHFIGKLPPDVMGLLRCGFPRFKGLYQVVGQIVALLVRLI